MLHCLLAQAVLWPCVGFAHVTEDGAQPLIAQDGGQGLEGIDQGQGQLQGGSRTDGDIVRARVSMKVVGLVQGMRSRRPPHR